VEVRDLTLAGLKLVIPTVYKDSRGFFLESYNQSQYVQEGIYCTFVQDNHSLSSKNTIRGMHFQKTPGQHKLVRVASGRIYDVAVDIRPESTTFGQWEGVYLDDESHHQLYIPPGFAHGFCVMSDQAQVMYKVTPSYSPKMETGFAWDDAMVAIDWPIANPLLSERDMEAPSFTDLFTISGGR
jgi:dTDP-4-dehydrorhamnose 3,5-epimerase